MARVGGRNTWIAVPAGLACAAIVGGLVWLSLPMVPVTVAWAGEMLRNATAPPPPTSLADTPAMRIAAGEGLDCRQIYSDALWNEMTWTGRTILDQGADTPPSAVMSLTEVLAPDVRLTCAWTDDDGDTVVSTVALVDADAAVLAEAALRGQAFACATDEDGLRCTGSPSGGSTETHVLRGGLWLVTAETGWHPEEYAPRLEREVFG
ncbi:hypothetical protein [Microbacterium sp. HJ5]